jgi:hypothetical protein
MHKWNVAKIIDAHGGANDLHAKLKAEGYHLHLNAVRQWRRRDNIPERWLAAIFVMGGPDPKSFIIEDIF